MNKGVAVEAGGMAHPAVRMGNVNDIGDNELLRRAVMNARSTRSRGYVPRWYAVMEVFTLGSTYARQLCVRFGFDPDEKVRR